MFWQVKEAWNSIRRVLKLSSVQAQDAHLPASAFDAEDENESPKQENSVSLGKHSRADADLADRGSQVITNREHSRQTEVVSDITGNLTRQESAQAEEMLEETKEAVSESRAMHSIIGDRSEAKKDTATETAEQKQALQINYRPTSPSSDEEATVPSARSTDYCHSVTNASKAKPKTQELNTAGVQVYDPRGQVEIATPPSSDDEAIVPSTRSTDYVKYITNASKAKQKIQELNTAGVQIHDPHVQVEIASAFRPYKRMVEFISELENHRRALTSTQRTVAGTNKNREHDARLWGTERSCQRSQKPSSDEVALQQDDSLSNHENRSSAVTSLPETAERKNTTRQRREQFYLEQIVNVTTGNSTESSTASVTDTHTPADQASTETTAEKLARVPVSVEKLIWAYLRAEYNSKLTKIMKQHRLYIMETLDENPMNVLLKFCGSDLEVEKGVEAFIGLYSELTNCTRMEHVDTAVDLDESFLKTLGHKYGVVALKLGDHKYGLIGTIGVSKLSQAQQELRQTSAYDFSQYVQQSHDTNSIPRPPVPTQADLAIALDTCLGLQTDRGTRILIYQADSTKLSVQAIVKTTDGYLKHGSESGCAITKAAGPELMQQYNNYISDNGPIPVSKFALTTGGNLTADYVLHAVGPQWPTGIHSEKEKEKEAQHHCLRSLTETFCNIFEFAYSQSLPSIAVPAISSGIRSYSMRLFPDRRSCSERKFRAMGYCGIL